jgi:NosR/NirI family transcriptional regulator, nitrous oxide reductase regulator
MKNYRVISYLFILIFLAGPVSQIVRHQTTTSLTPDLEAARIVFPEADRFSEKAGTPPHFKAYRIDPATGKEELAGIAYLTTDVDKVTLGYGGPIKIMVGVHLDGSISKIHLVSHSETLSYVSELDSFLNQFQTKNPQNNFELGKDIDGITGATITSEAITRAVGNTLKIMANQILGKSGNSPAFSARRISWDQILVPLLLFAIAITGVISHQKLVRWIALLGGLLYFGILKSTMVSVVQIANIGLVKFPSFAQTPLWYLLVGLTLLSAILWGLVFCGSLCPFAATQEILFSISKKFSFPRLKPARSFEQRARYLKYGVLFSAVLISYFLGNTQATGIEPYLTLFTRKGNAFAWTLLGLMLLAACFDFRFWCKYLCPVGACLGLIARFSPFRIRIQKWCTGCQSCAKVCPTDAITLNADNRPVIDHPECILCGNCIRECRQNALRLIESCDAEPK